MKNPLGIFPCILTALLSFFECASAQISWFPPVPVTSGDQDDTHASFVRRGPPYEGPRPEWMIFQRSSPATHSSAICAMQTTLYDNHWNDTIEVITVDTNAVNDFPAMAEQSWVPYPSPRMALWQRSVNGTSSVVASYDPGSGWSKALHIDSGFGSASPSVIPGDSGFAAVWIRSGRVVYAEFKHDAWSDLEIVSLHNDTLTAKPQVIDLTAYSGLPNKPLVIWESRLHDDSATTRILYSFRTDSSGWSLPDTIAATGQNLNPRFVKNSVYGPMTLSWESNRANSWQIFGAYGCYCPGGLWSTRSDVYVMPDTYEHRDASFTDIGIITGRNGNTTSADISFMAGVWLSTISGIAAVNIGTAGGYGAETFMPAEAVEYRNPIISTGTGYDPWEVWAVWESNESGYWNLHGSRTDIVLGVIDPENIPSTLTLAQNYPNPFNPTTTLSFVISHSSFVSLKVYDVPGREVATIVNEELPPGEYTRTWDAKGVPSGVYFYRMTAGRFSETKKLVIVR